MFSLRHLAQACCIECECMCVCVHVCACARVCPHVCACVCESPHDMMGVRCSWSVPSPFVAFVLIPSQHRCVSTPVALKARSRDPWGPRGSIWGSLGPYFHNNMMTLCALCHFHSRSPMRIQWCFPEVPRHVISQYWLQKQV